MFWVNVDKPTKTCTIHSEDCPYVLKKETQYKGINELKRDGGWLSFAHIETAENHCQEEAKGYIIRKCRFCL